MINGPKKDKNKIYDSKFYMNKERKLRQFDNTLNFYNKLSRTCLRLKELKPDNTLSELSNNIELLKKTRRRYLQEKIKSFNDDIVNTFQNSKVFDEFVGIVLPFEQKNKKIIVHILSQYSFFFATKERIPVKLTMECIDADELNENKKMDEEFLVKRALTVQANDLDNESNVIGMDSDEKKKEMSKNEIAEMNKILEKVKYENEHPNEEVKNEEKVQAEEQSKVNQENSNNVFNPFIKPWSETERQIKERSHFKMFNSLSIVSFIAKANDDLRQEVMTMQLIKKYDEIFKNENIPLKLHPYEILITSNSSGLIEFLPDTISFDALKKNLLEKNITFLDFFKQRIVIIWGIDLDVTDMIGFWEINRIQRLLGEKIISYTSYSCLIVQFCSLLIKL
jgi:hypothetical protein